MEFNEHLIDLDKSQIRKLGKNKALTVKHNQIGSGLTIHLSEPNHKKVMSGYKNGKNKIIKLSPEELAQNEMAGTGFFKTLHSLGISKKDFMKGTKQVAKVAAPIVKEIAKPAGAALGTALVTAAGNPELAVVAAPVGAALANEASNQLTKYAGSGIMSDAKKALDKPIKTITKVFSGNGVSKYEYGFKTNPTYPNHSIGGSGVDARSPIVQQSIWKNGYHNPRRNFDNYQPTQVFGNGFKPVSGGSFLPAQGL